MLLRTLLFTPGNNMRMIDKVCSLAMDAIIYDLEDAVPMSDKQTARSFVRDSLQKAAQGNICIFVRVNGWDTGLLEDDLNAVVQPGLNGVVLPKAESPEDIEKLSEQLDLLEKERGLQANSLSIVPILETAKGLINAYSIACGGSRIAALALGGVDFSRDMRITLTKEGGELSYPRAHIAVAAKAAGVLAIDTPCIIIRDDEQLNRESQTAKQFGFTGKLLVHPSQIDIVNMIFSPTDKQIAYSKNIVEAFEEALKQGLGVISLDGKMIDVANYRQAQDVLMSYEEISRRTKPS